jgi:VWFA-related protein
LRDATLARVPLTCTVSLLVSLAMPPAIPAGIAQSAPPEPATGGAPAAAQSKASPAGQEPQGEAPAASIKVTTRVVTVPVTVMDSRGNFLYDLDAKDFQIYDNGQPQRLRNFGVALNPLTLVVVVETNDTTEGMLPQVHPVGPLFSSLMLGDKGMVGVVCYADQVRVAQEFSSDGSVLSKTLGSLHPEGRGSRLNDALERAIAMLETRPKEEQRVIVAFSDGRDHGSDTKKDDLVKRATGSEVTIYGLGFNPAQSLWRDPPPDQTSPLDPIVRQSGPPGMANTPSTQAIIYDSPVPPVPIVIATGEVIRSTVASSLLEYYAGYTGGVFDKHWSKGALQDQLNKLATEIHSQYDLAYVPDSAAAGFHRIEVEVDRPHLKVRTRAGYFLVGDTLPQSKQDQAKEQK